MTKEIKAGLLLKITTWENDADNYNTVELDGLTDGEVRFYLEVCNLFRSDGRRSPGFYGNGDYDKVGEAVDAAIHEIVDKHISLGNPVPQYWNRHEGESKEYFEKWPRDFYNDVLYDLVGRWNYGEYYRVFDGAEVYLVPENSIKNVTKDYI